MTIKEFKANKKAEKEKEFLKYVRSIFGRDLKIGDKIAIPEFHWTSLCGKIDSSLKKSLVMKYLTVKEVPPTIGWGNAPSVFCNEEDDKNHHPFYLGKTVLKDCRFEREGEREELVIENKSW